LGLTNIREGFDRIKAAWKRGVSATDSIGRRQEMIYLSEQSVYELAFTSRKPEAVDGSPGGHCQARRLS